MLSFIHMGLLNFLTKANMQHTRGEKIQEENKMPLSLIFIYVFVSKECIYYVFAFIYVSGTTPTGPRTIFSRNVRHFRVVFMNSYVQ